MSFERIDFGGPVPRYDFFRGFCIGGGRPATDGKAPAPVKPFSLFDLNPHTRRLSQQQRSAALASVIAEHAAASGEPAPQGAAPGPVAANQPCEEQAAQQNRKRKRAGSLAEPPQLVGEGSGLHDGGSPSHDGTFHTATSDSGSSSSSGSEEDPMEQDEDGEALSDQQLLQGLEQHDLDGTAVNLTADKDVEEAFQDALEQLEDLSESESDGFIPLGGGQPFTSADGAADPQQQQGSAQTQRGSSGFMPPWVPFLPRFNSPSLRLHQELVAFTHMLEPTPQEADSRRTAVDAVRKVVQGIWKSADVLPFGSYATGLYTPASDIDLVLVGTRVASNTSPLQALGTALLQKQLIKPDSLQQIFKAKVPIIKFEMRDSGLLFDVCCEQQGGLQAVEYVKELLQQWPALKPLALVLKVFLSQREMNEVYTGGVGSFALVNMIATSLQLHASRRQKQAAAAASRGRRHSGQATEEEQQQAAPLDGNLGVLLMDFFRLFGRQLQCANVGITSADGGAFIHKRYLPKQPTQPSWKDAREGPLLIVQDPLEPANNTSQGSYAFMQVKRSFDHAYMLMCVPCEARESLLGRIIHLEPVLAGREVPGWVRQATKVVGRDRWRPSQDHHHHHHHNHNQQQQQQARRHVHVQRTHGHQHEHHHREHHHRHHHHGSKGQDGHRSPYGQHKSKRRKLQSPAEPKGRKGWHHEDDYSDNDHPSGRQHHKHNKHKYKDKKKGKHHHQQQQRQGGGNEGGGGSSSKRKRRSAGSDHGSGQRRGSGGGRGKHTHFDSD